jgi:hypothetical protein
MKSSAQSVLVLVAIVFGFNACATTDFVNATHPLACRALLVEN